MRLQSTICALLFLFLLGSAAQAREFGAGTQPLGMADAVRSHAAGPAALYFNPAGLARLMMYGIELGYDFENPFDGHGLHVGVGDGKTNQYVAAGVGYSFLLRDFEGIESQGHQLRIGLASGYRSPTFSALIGAGLTWKKQEFSPGRDFDGISMDVGMMLDILQSVRIGVVGYNLIKHDEQAFLPIQLGMGISFYYAGLTVGFDTVLDFLQRDEVTPIYSIGAEYFLMGMVGIRTGFEIDQLDEAKRLAFGLGYTSNFWGLDISYRQDVEDTDEIVVGVAVRFYLP